MNVAELSVSHRTDGWKMLWWDLLLIGVNIVEIDLGHENFVFYFSIVLAWFHLLGLKGIVLFLIIYCHFYWFKSFTVN